MKTKLVRKKLNTVGFYSKIGWEHILSAGALDHILFLVALCAVYSVKNRKQALILVTAFTLGHSITLLLSATDELRIPTNWVEFLIPFTIIGSAIFSYRNRKNLPENLQFNYAIALLFGLVHGLGFANTIRFMLMGESGLALPLFSFNLGLECAQILVVCMLIILNFIVEYIIKIKREYWISFLSATTTTAAFIMAIQRIPFKIK